MPYTLPGEICEISIIEDRKQYAFAELNTLIRQSVKRTAPECPLFGICGGCSYLHTQYLFELEMKKQILNDTITRTANIHGDSIPEIDIVSDERYGYRSHITVKVSNGKPGFFSSQSNSDTPLAENGCLLAAPEINAYLFSGDLHDGNLRISMSHDHQIMDSSVPDSIVVEQENGLYYQHNVNGFFQANRFLRSRMLELVKAGCSPHSGLNILDIGCGCGFFSLYMARHGARCRGFDINRNSIEMAKHNAGMNGISNVTFEVKAAADIHPGRYRTDVVIVDPPRAGLDKRSRKTITSIQPERLVYVSCEPSTFARDCGYFTRSGYKLESCTLIDMFPGTHHIEIISSFLRC